MSTNVYPTLPKLFAPWQLIKIFTGAMGLRGFDLHGIIPPTKPHHHTSKPTHSTSAKVELHRSSHFAECHWDEREKCYKLFEDEKFTVKAVPIKHSIFCLGYVMQEKSKKGNLKVDVLKSLGLSPSPLYKQLQMGQDITWNGQVIKAADVTEPSQEGRKIVILGDTCDPSAITELAMDADVLIHEATCTNEELNRALLHHHSTAGMAGDFARRIRAKNLILTHFSPSKFHSNEFDECVAIRKLVDQAKTAFGSSSVFPAHVKHWIFCFGDDLGLLEISCAHGHRKGGHGKDTIT